jgi:hypothetical protein
VSKVVWAFAVFLAAMFLFCLDLICDLQVHLATAFPLLVVHNSSSSLSVCFGWTAMA